MLFAQLISRCAKDIDTLIESLPSEESSTELQVQSLRRLEAENKEAAEQLEEVSLFCKYLFRVCDTGNSNVGSRLCTQSLCLMICYYI